MKNKSLIYALMFMFAFILPSFSTIPEKEFDKNNIVQTTSDSVTVSVKFSNPELTITDDRIALEQKLASQLSTNKELLDVVKSFDMNLSKLVGLQERRYGHIVAQLEEKTGYSVETIYKFSTVNKRLYLGYIFTTILFIAALLVIYNTSYRRLREVIFAPLFVTTMVYLGLMLIWKLFVPLSMGLPYLSFCKLLELSPF